VNLIADIGNSSTKLAVYNKQEKVSVTRVDDLKYEELDKLLLTMKIDKAIISSVKVLPRHITDLLILKIPFVHTLSHKSKLPFKIEYETPDSLGTDRIAAIAGANRLFPGSEILVIDAGTAITFDFLSGNSYKGGNISPGITMRFKALNHFTGQLPLLTPSGSFNSPGLNTTDAITAGVIMGVLYEINEYIRTFEEIRPVSGIILTGGDGEFIKDKIDHKVNYLPDVVIDGLNYILEYNA
jgi:type III pantothenate kinase